MNNSNLIVGKWVQNKTWDYLVVPCIFSYGEEFSKMFSNVFVMAVGVEDSYYKLHKDINKLFILCDSGWDSFYYEKFIEELKTQDFYIADYVFGGNLFPRKHMIVLKIPVELNDYYQNFILGNYSKLSTCPNLKYLSKKCKDVITKTTSCLTDFKQELHEEFGELKLTYYDILTMSEFSLPPIAKKEIFNYEEKQVFLRQYLKNKKKNDLQSKTN
jgi:hypothetical protein